MTADLAIEAAKIISLYVFLLMTYFLVRRWLQNRNYPPGPTGLPLLGYLPFLRNNASEVLEDLRKKHGGIFSFYIGPQLIVCVSDYNSAKELLQKTPTFSRTRNKHLFFNFGLAAYSGKEWKENRSLTVRIMRYLGLSGTIYEDIIHEDLGDLINEIKSWKGRPMPVQSTFVSWQANKIMHILCGKKFDKKNDATEIKIIQGGAQKLAPNLIGTGVHIIIPWIWKFLEFFHLSSHQEFFHVLRGYESIFKKEIEKKIHSEGTDARKDFIIHYLDEIKKKNEHSSSHSFTKENLGGNLLLLFIAAVDNIVISFIWLLLFMAKHQDIQKKVHEEICSVIGSHGFVSYKDRENLPYTLATVMEVLRLMSPAVFPPRYTVDEFKFKGYTIPRNCYILCDIRSISHNPQYFDEPMKFMPERFLTENGTKIAEIDGYFPFSFGKRNCPGESVSMRTLYIWFVTIMQNFKVVFPPGKAGDMSSQFSVIMVPKPQELCFLER